MQRQRGRLLYTKRRKTTISWWLASCYCAEKKMEVDTTKCETCTIPHTKFWFCEPSHPALPIVVHSSLFVCLSLASSSPFSPSSPLQRNASLKISSGLSDSLIWRKCVSWSFHCPNSHAHTHKLSLSHTQTQTDTCKSDEYFFLSSNHVGEGQFAYTVQGFGVVCMCVLQVTWESVNKITFFTNWVKLLCWRCGKKKTKNVERLLCVHRICILCERVFECVGWSCC